MDQDALRRMEQDARETMRRITEGAVTYDDVVGSAESEDGYVRVRMGATGVVEAIELDPKVMRMPSQDLAEVLTATLNQARDHLAEQLAERGADPGREFQALTERLTGEHGSLGEALTSMQAQLQETLSRATVDVERMKRDMAARRRPR